MTWVSVHLATDHGRKRPGQRRLHLALWDWVSGFGGRRKDSLWVLNTRRTSLATVRHQPGNNLHSPCLHSGQTLLIDLNTFLCWASLGLGFSQHREKQEELACSRNSLKILAFGQEWLCYLFKKKKIFFYILYWSITNYPGIGNGTPFQYSCLENSMGRGAWQATGHGAGKSQAWLSA